VDRAARARRRAAVHRALTRPTSQDGGARRPPPRSGATASTRGKEDVQDTVPGYVFSPLEVWNGRTIDIGGKPTLICRGLIEDWAIWIRENGDRARFMALILLRLAHPGEPLEVGPLLRLSVNDARDIPSIKTPYADAVRIVHASAGVRRIMGLAYMLMWSLG
jgi:hypothetical protein